MKMLRPSVIALALLAFAEAGPVSAGSTVAEANYENIHEQWQKAHAAGGYGIPFVAVPRAVTAALLGDGRQNAAGAPPTKSG